MLDNSLLSTIVGAVAPIAGVYFGYWIFKRNERKDIKTEAEQNASLMSDVGYIKAGIDDLKRRQEKADDNFVLLIQRVSHVEASAHQAHKRLDEISKGRGAD